MTRSRTSMILLGVLLLLPAFLAGCSKKEEPQQAKGSMQAAPAPGGAGNQAQLRAMKKGD